MNKKTFLWILEIALLHFDGVSVKRLRKLLPDGSAIPETIIQSGLKLCEYLKEIKTDKEISIT